MIDPPKACLYDVNSKVIVPATKPAEVSMVEFMAADGPQPPEWFCSHWWGEPISDFLVCLEQHAIESIFAQIVAASGPPRFLGEPPPPGPMAKG